MVSKSKTRIPKRFDGIPETPTNGNYVFTGQNLWSHAESFSEAYRIWRGGGGNPAGSLGIVDVTDDFQISHADGSVRAEKVQAVWISWEGGRQE